MNTKKPAPKKTVSKAPAKSKPVASKTMKRTSKNSIFRRNNAGIPLVQYATRGGKKTQVTP